ncbi:MAG: DUF2846 domain-containing protein [Verrucomicrobia bacterium]|nr:DUF2846 domain-containing protein [Verrucomicrobiota bacterium]
MKKLIGVVFIACFAILMTGCATGPKFSALKSSIPPVSQVKGRIYFYRTAVLGAAIQPKVKLNGETIGTAKPKGFFYVDRDPGNYEVETTTEVKRKLSLTLDKGMVRYVRLNIAMGFFAGHVYPELVEDATGEKEIAKCSQTGRK